MLSDWIYSEAGHNHANEDAVELRRLPNMTATLVCALAGGQGGQSGGGRAARTAVRESIDAARRFAPADLLQERTWRSIISDADKAIEQTPDAGYTTLVCLVVTDAKLCGASCGDSAALLLNDGQEQVLTEYQIKNPPVGSGASQPISFSTALGRVWKVLVVSDGVWKYVGWEHVRELARQHQGQTLIDELRKAALARWAGKLPDDFSIAVIEPL